MSYDLTCEVNYAEKFLRNRLADLTGGPPVPFGSAVREPHEMLSELAVFTTTTVNVSPTPETGLQLLR
jgi:hypothetical protein